MGEKDEKRRKRRKKWKRKKRKKRKKKIETTLFICPKETNRSRKLKKKRQIMQKIDILQFLNIHIEKFEKFKNRGNSLLKTTD